MTEKAKKWSPEVVELLLSTVGSADPVSAASVDKASEVLGISTRSVAAKLRQLDRQVESLAAAKTPTFTAAESDELKAFVEANAGQFTYKDVAEKFDGGKFTAKQVQGKLLALELTGSIKPAEKLEAARTYTEAEEATFIKMANGGSFIEDIATALGKSVASIRGKALSLATSKSISGIPSQKQSLAKQVVDPIESLGEAIATMTVEEIAQATDKTERGVKTLLTRRGIDVANYKGKTKRAKAEAKAHAVAA